MDSLTATPLLHGEGKGGIAVSADGTLLAVVDYARHCVRMYNLDSEGKAHGDAIVYGDLAGPTNACFVNRGGADTLLICDRNNFRIVEVTAAGVFLRVIRLEAGDYAWGVAYCGHTDVIAVTGDNAVVLDYMSGAVKFTVGSRFPGSQDGRMWYPMGVGFTADGDCILVVDWGNNRVSKFKTATGEFIAHVASNISDPIYAVERDDGSVLVLCDDQDGSVFIAHGSTVDKVTTVLGVHSFAYSSVLGGVVVNCSEGHVYLMHDSWTRSSRSAWLGATCID